MRLHHHLTWFFMLLLGIISMSPGCTQTYDIEVQHAITYATYGTDKLQLDLYRPMRLTENHPVVLAIHGGFWREGDRMQLGPLSEQLAARGCDVVNIEYRLLPQAKYPEQYADVRAALCWIRDNTGKYHFDTTHLFLFGVSAGAQLAALLGVNNEKDLPKAAGVISLSGPMDFTGKSQNLAAEMLLKQYLDATQTEKPELYAQASPITHVDKDDPPFLFIHGLDDHIVPYEQTEKMSAALKKVGVPVTLFPIKGMGHVFPKATSPAGQLIINTIQAFIKQYDGHLTEQTAASATK